MSQNTSTAVAGLATVLTLLAVGLIVTTAAIILLVLCIRELQQDDNGKRGINNNKRKGNYGIFFLYKIVILSKKVLLSL